MAEAQKRPQDSIPGGPPKREQPPQLKVRKPSVPLNDAERKTAQEDVLKRLQLVSALLDFTDPDWRAIGTNLRKMSRGAFALARKPKD